MAKIKFIIRYIVLATLMPLSISTTWAQSRTRIFGIVKDEKGSPVELATVRVTGQVPSLLPTLKVSIRFGVTQQTLYALYTP